MVFHGMKNLLTSIDKEKLETIEEIKENYDYVQSWISKDEYSSLLSYLI